MTAKINYIKSYLEDETLRNELAKVVADVDALIPQNEQDILNVSYLRFQESRSCITPIDFICKESVRQGKIYTEIPFDEFIKIAQF